MSKSTRHIKTLVLALVAVFVMSAIAVSAASAALPEFVPKSGAFPVKFTSSSGAGFLLTKAKHEVKCTADSNVGEITNAKKVAKVVVTFTGCEEPALKVKCNTAKQAAGTIVTNELKGEIGYLNAAKTLVGLSLEPAATTGARLFAEFECTSLEKIKVGEAASAGHDSVIGEIQPPYKVFSKTAELKYVCVSGKPGEQEWRSFSGGALDYLETKGGTVVTFGYEESVLTRLIRSLMYPQQKKSEIEA